MSESNVRFLSVSPPAAQIKTVESGGYGAPLATLRGSLSGRGPRDRCCVLEAAPP